MQKGKNPEREKKGWKGGKENGREARRVNSSERENLPMVLIRSGLEGMAFILGLVSCQC